MTREEIELKSRAIDEKISKLYAAQKTLMSQHEVVCGQEYMPRGGCGTIHKIRDLEIIYTSWGNEYDGYRSGESKFVCPECGLENRLIDEHGSGPKRQWLADLGRYFKSSSSRHEH